MKSKLGPAAPGTFLSGTW